MRREALQVTILCLLFGSLGEVGSWSDDDGRIIYPVALDDDRLLPFSDYDTPPMYEMEEFVPLTDEQEAYRKSTAGDEKRVRKAIGTSGSGSGSGLSDIPTTTPVIDVEGCILPNDVPSPPTDTEEMLTQRALCDVSCLEAHDLVESQSLELQELWNVFPISVLTRNNCGRYGNYEACRLACFSRSEDPNINNCPRTCRRELCNGICGGSLCFRDSFPPCGINCGGAPCRNGCGFFDGLSSRGPYPQDLNPLTLPPPIQEDFQLPQYTLDITGAAPSDFRVADRTVVSVLARVESQPGDYSYYLLDSSLRLKLEAFICRRVNVSFAIATPSFQLSAYSEPATVEVNNTVLLPDQLDGFDTSFTPDLRAGFYREHILTVEWERPNGFERVTDYTVTVDLKSGPGCGNTGVETYQTDRNATNLTVYSSPTHRFYSQCSYIIRVQTNLLRPGDEVPCVFLFPPTEYPVPDDSDVQRSCPRVFNVTTMQYDVTLSWTLNTFPAFVYAIHSFVIFRLNVRNGAEIGFNREQDVTAVPGQREYSESFQYDPILQEGLRYTLSVRFVFLQNLTTRVPDFSFECEVDPLPLQEFLPDCIIPNNVPPPPTDTEEVLMQRALCDVTCLLTHVVSPGNLELQELWNVFPLSVLTRNNCPRYANYEACRLACFSRVEDPSIGDCTGTCRGELCNGICGSSFCFSDSFPPCGINCGGAPCRNGCGFFDGLSSRGPYPQDLNPLTLPPPTQEDIQLPLYTLDITGAAPSAFRVTDRTVVSVLVRVESQPGDYSYYLLDSSLRLNLEAFICRRVSVSFVVATPSFQLSSYSEPATVEVNNIEVTFFQLRVGPLQHCQEWIQQSNLVAEMERGIRRAIAAVVAENCNCSFAIESIAVGTITCSSTLLHQIVYRSAIQSVNADQEVGILQEWVGTSSARITISPFILAVDPSCPVRIGSLNDPPCDEPDTVCPDDFSLVTRDFRITRTARQCLRRLFGWPHILGQGCTARVGRRRPRN